MGPLEVGWTAAFHALGISLETAAATGVACHLWSLLFTAGLGAAAITAVTLDSIVVDQIDALDGSPVIDIKSFFPHDNEGPVKVPDWQ